MKFDGLVLYVNHSACSRPLHFYLYFYTSIDVLTAFFCALGWPGANDSVVVER